MRIFGLEITRAKAYSAPGWRPIIRESFGGAWQRDIDVSKENVLSHSAVYACVTLISSDIAKLEIQTVRKNTNGIWVETELPNVASLLRKPNHFQNRIEFIQSWAASELVSGNAYILKGRDERGITRALYVLDPNRVKPLVSESGEVFYQLMKDNLIPGGGDTIVPAREIIHTKYAPLYHPLCGVSPIYASGMAAVQALRIHNHSIKFFENAANPGGVLTAPNSISEPVAERIKKEWADGFTGSNAGKVAVLGDGLKFESMHVNAADSKLIEQLKLTQEQVCSAFKVPAYMIGAASPPAYNNIEALNQAYYSQCLQVIIERMELALDDGLELPENTGVEFDLDDLLRMDTPSKVKAAADAVGSGAVSPNEARKRFFNLGPVEGGESPYLQVQNYSLSALAKRDSANPLATAPAPEPEPEADDDEIKAFFALVRERAEHHLRVDS